MRKTLLFVVVLVGCQLAIMAQAPAGQAESKASQVAALKKLAWMAGQWKGEGSVTMGPNNRKQFRQTENIQFKLDGTLLLVEGTGTSPEGQPVFNAIAVISYDANAKAYRWRSFTHEGLMTDADVRIIDDNNLTWGFKTFTQRFIRYTVKHTEQDQWIEFGEFSTDEKNWVKFHEMTLSRMK